MIPRGLGDFIPLSYFSNDGGNSWAVSNTLPPPDNIIFDIEKWNLPYGR